MRIVILFLALVMLVGMCMGDEQNGSPSIFVFGDSLVDAGNNNYINSFSRANYAPNGIDFVRGPTGRYTNGRTIVDIIGQELGVRDFIPPYLAPTTVGPVLLQGVNYASGGGGILNHTGKIFGGRINMDAQLDNFANTKQDIVSSIGATAAEDLLNRRTLIFIAIGSNDFINNYIPSPIDQRLTPPNTFVGALISRFRLQLTRLYNLGGRKILVAGVGPIGCIPFERDSFPAAGENCVPLPNQLAELYNTQLKGLIGELNSNLEGSKFVFADVYYIVDDIIQNYQSYGFVNTNSSCCSFAGRYGGVAPCGAWSRVCAERGKYFFWDPYHPSDTSNIFITKRLMDSEDSRDIWPINVRKLIQS